MNSHHVLHLRGGRCGRWGHNGLPDEAVLLEDGVLQGQVVPPVDQQLVLEVLRGVEVLARRLVAIAPTLQEKMYNILVTVVVAAVVVVVLVVQLLLPRKGKVHGAMAFCN